MGQQIGFQCAGHGLDVVLYDIEPEALESARGRIDAYAEGLVAGGVIGAEVRDSALARITMTTDAAVAAGDADLLSEAVPEDPAQGPGAGRVRRAVPAADDLCDQHLDPAALAVCEATGRPDR